MNTGFEFSDIYDEVVSRAGGEQSTAEDVIRVRRGMRLLLERWEARGFNTWRIKSTMVVSNNGQPFITMPSDLDDVMQVTWENGGAMTRMTAAEYMQIARKDQQGRPGSYWLKRDINPKLYLHPNGDGYKLDVWYVARPSDFDRRRDGMDDVPGRWLEALISGLALDLSRKRPRADGSYDDALIMRLKGEASEAEEIAIRADRERVPFRYRTSY